MVDISAKRRKLETPDPALSQPSPFRNVSSCRRCRLRKGRCDQRLPRCRPCEKVGARCISYDPITRREFPRSYVYFLETRIAYLQSVLVKHEIPFEPEAAFNEKQIVTAASLATEIRPVFDSDAEDTSNVEPGPVEHPVDNNDNSHSKTTDNDILRSATTTTSSALLESIPSKPSLSPMRSLPDRDLANRLVQLYFEHANPQLPVLHRGEFTDLLAATYATPDTARPQRTLFFLFIVFAIGAGIVFEDRPAEPNERTKPTKSQPEAYHAAALSHLYSSSSSSNDFTRLESLQAVILLAHFALLRPVAPGPAHTASLALRTAIDMGLYMDRQDDPHPTAVSASSSSAKSTCWTPLDQRRRLWWCVYSLDRLIAPCTGRPFGIADQVISTGFPAIPADQAIRQAGCVPCSKYIARHYFQLRVLQSEVHEGVLGYCAARGRDDSSSSSSSSPSSSGDVTAAAASFPSPPLGDDSDSCRGNASRFLRKLGVRSFGEWVGNVRTRLDAWRARVPVVRRPGAWFPAALLELDYWLTVNLLYRGSMRVPAGLAWDSDLGFGLGLGGRPSAVEGGRGGEDDDESVSIEVAEASQKVLQIYRMMHHVRLVNYTYLATHSIFMAGEFLLFLSLAFYILMSVCG